MIEQKTLRKLDVQPGDVVLRNGGPLKTVANVKDINWCSMTDYTIWLWDEPIWTIISRASLNTWLPEC